MKTISSKIVEAFFIRTSDPNRKLWLHRFFVLILTFLVYAIYHMSRKPMSVVKTKLFNGNISDCDENWAPFDQPNANGLLSLMDGAYWGTYAIGMFFTGYVAERSNLRYYLTISMSLCGLMCIVSGLAFYLQIHSLTFFVIVQVLTGLLEATGWPAVLAIIGGWFGSSKKGFIFGVWSLHTSVGNMIGTAVAGAFVDHYWGLSFIVPGVVCILMAAVVFVLLVEKPSDVDLKVEMAFITEDDLQTSRLPGGSNSTLKLDDDEVEVERCSTTTTVTIAIDDNDNNDIINVENSNTNKPTTSTSKENGEDGAISLWGALTIPGVVEFSICLFFTKSVSYIFLNWLPKFISARNKISPSESAYMSIMFDIGGCIGSIMAGLMSDFIGAGGLTCIVFLLLAIPSLFLLGHFSHISLAINLGLQFLAGFFINGPYSLITTAVSANLACLVPSKAATATVSAIIDGTGSIGAAIGPAITGPLSDFNWDSVFYVCMFGDFIAAVCLFRVGYGELKQKILNRRRKRMTIESSHSIKTTTTRRKESESSTNGSLASCIVVNYDDRKNIIQNLP